MSEYIASISLVSECFASISLLPECIASKSLLPECITNKSLLPECFASVFVDVLAPRPSGTKYVQTNTLQTRRKNDIVRAFCTIVILVAGQCASKTGCTSSTHKVIVDQGPSARTQMLAEGSRILTHRRKEERSVVAQDCARNLCPSERRAQHLCSSERRAQHLCPSEQRAQHLCPPEQKGNLAEIYRASIRLAAKRLHSQK